MRRSEFLRAVDEEFGARSNAMTHDLFLGDVGMTAHDALEAGIPPRQIWLALCAEADVPPERRYGVGRVEPRRH
ncbi:DUF3046 domain-containing protein [Microbacterium esteraromaticum]|uniref:DUF3046 domain-containing protein n=1 Tax=Microbacterium esteraromaticum TaxID=57043 RepID=UPI0023683704|nr:DUF3046 domain-containing protein [Microbacterium esteraromaticum]WDH80002.1 DUF3046 domain-containing protein [Microbacterium esteraromaticum]